MSKINVRRRVLRSGSYGSTGAETIRFLQAALLNQSFSRLNENGSCFGSRRGRARSDGAGSPHFEKLLKFVGFESKTE
jgi:hypothetical protein